MGVRGGGRASEVTITLQERFLSIKNNAIYISRGENFLNLRFDLCTFVN